MKKLGLILFLILVVFISCISNQVKGKSGSEWTLVWKDEFSGNKIDKKKWMFDIGNGFYDGENWVSGWGNAELEYYTDQSVNSFVSKGILTIQVVKEDFKGMAGAKSETFSYTSAKIKSLGLFSKQYGKFEVRASFPGGKGLWPAIWLLPEQNKFGAWAASGEIDIAEGWGSNTSKVAGTIHYGGVWPANKFSGTEYNFSPGDSTADWHLYSIEWEPGEIRWYVDGSLYQTQNRWFTPGGPYPAPFNKPFYIIINLAVGGNFDGNPDQATLFPAQMQIDYVRVYELTGRSYRTPVNPGLDIPAEPRPAEARPQAADGNEVYNNGFTDNTSTPDYIEGIEGTAYWIFLHLPEFIGDGKFSILPIADINYAQIEILAPGNQPYSVQLIQRVVLVRGHKYKASFDAKSTGTRRIQVKLNGDEDNAWVTYSNSEMITLSDEMTRYEFSFVMEKESDLYARFEFNTGLDSKTVWIGNVRLDDITN